MTSVPERDQIMVLVAAAIVSGARQARACHAISLSERTLQRWQGDQARAGDLRPLRVQDPKNKLTMLERQRILTVANSDEFGHLPPSQIVPQLADQEQFVGSESSFYRVLKDAKQLQHRTGVKAVQTSSQAPCTERHSTGTDLLLGHHVFTEPHSRYVFLSVPVHRPV